MTTKKETLQNLVIKLCKENPRSAGELAKILDMNFHTVRTGYIYPLVKKKVLKRLGNAKVDAKYKS